MPGRHKSILIVEDCSLSRKLTRALFDSEGFHVRTAASGREALADLARARVDVVLIDLRLPDIHGLDLGRRIRTDLRMHDLLALATSADPDVPEDLVREAGFDGFLPKPIQIDDLQARLRGHRRPAVSVGLDEEIGLAAARLGLRPSDPWLAEFLARCERDLATLRRADVETARSVAHRLAGASGMIGGARVARACLEIERSAGSRDTRPALDRLEEEIESLRAALLAFARGGSASANPRKGVLR